MSETVTALAFQVEQLTTLVQDTVFQRLTALETELMGQLPDLALVRDRYLAEPREGKQSPEYKRTKGAIDRFISEVRSQ